MILAKPAILKARELGNILIEPFSTQNLRNCSYDVTLGPWYWLETQPEPIGGDPVIIPSERDTFAADYGVVLNPYDAKSVARMWNDDGIESMRPMRAMPTQHTMPGIPKGSLVIPLHPGQNALCHTNEFIGGMDRKITTMMKARSSIGRNQVTVCRCAGAGDIGFCNRFTIELSNAGNRTVLLVVGRRIAQLWFMETTGLDDFDDRYFVSGKYQTRDLRDKTFEQLEASWKPEMMLPRAFMDVEVVDPSECRDCKTDESGICDYHLDRTVKP